MRVELDADEVEAEPYGCNRGVAQAEEGVEHEAGPFEPVQAHALLGHLRRERRRMRAVAVAALDGLVGHEPGIAAAAQPVAGRCPALDVGGVLVGHSNGAPVEPRAPAGREMKDVLVAVVDEALAVDGLVVAYSDIAVEAGRRAGLCAIDRDRLDPVDRVLKLEVAASHLSDFEWDPGVRGLGPDVEEEGGVILCDTSHATYPPVGPGEVVGPREVVGVAPVLDAQIVGR